MEFFSYFIDISRYYLVDKPVLDNNYIKTATMSLFIGGLSHIILDMPSHEFSFLFHPFLIIQLPEPLLILLIDTRSMNIPFRSGDMNIYVYVVIWWIESILCILISLYYVNKILKKPFVDRKGNF